MEPSTDFWSGVGTGVANSPGWMVVGAILVIGVLFVWAKYVHPDNKEIRLREIEVREREAQNDAERIKANSALAENMRGLRESNDHLAQQSAALAAGIEESKTRSRGMGEKVDRMAATADHIRDTADHTAEKVDEIHTLIRQGRFGPEGTE